MFDPVAAKGKMSQLVSGIFSLSLPLWKSNGLITLHNLVSFTFS